MSSPSIPITVSVESPSIEGNRISAMATETMLSEKRVIAVDKCIEGLETAMHDSARPQCHIYISHWDNTTS